MTAQDTHRDGRLVLVVGPSGSGKDTLMAGARARLPEEAPVVFARRVVTRPADAGAEDHEAATDEAFQARAAAGGFLVQWRAHGLSYGLPAALREDLAAGRAVVANVSRAVVSELAAAGLPVAVIEVTADREVLRQRLTARGREAPEDVAARLDRPDWLPPPGVPVFRVRNDGTPEDGVAAFVAALSRALGGVLALRRVPIDCGRRRVCFVGSACSCVDGRAMSDGGRLELRAFGRTVLADVQAVDEAAGLVAPGEIGLSAAAFDALGLPEGTAVALDGVGEPVSLPDLRRKLRGEELDEVGYTGVVRDIVEGCYDEASVGAFLAAATTRLSDAEVVAMTRARARVARTLRWTDRRMVVDKHGMGGIPGSRISMILVPIVAAHGLTMPKASSRAITSPAGTADTMEVLADVDLDAAAVRRVVEEAGGCVVWNGRITHTPLDDIMNAITRPLELDSARFSVASILSKKLAAGATHVAIDIPAGPHCKLRCAEDAAELARLFEATGQALGLTVAACVTDGTQPVGQGIGPALEVRDVLQVLGNDPAAPADLREKALTFAGLVLGWDPEVGPEAGRARAEELLASGAALARFDRILDLQGRRPEPLAPGACTAEVRAEADGTIDAVDTWQLCAVARAAGAPRSKAAGLDLLARRGDPIAAGAVLYRIHAATEVDLKRALRVAAGGGSGFRIATSGATPRPLPASFKSA